MIRACRCHSRRSNGARWFICSACLNASDHTMRFQQAVPAIYTPEDQGRQSRPHRGRCVDPRNSLQVRRVGRCPDTARGGRRLIGQHARPDARGTSVARHDLGDGGLDIHAEGHEANPATSADADVRTTSGDDVDPESRQNGGHAGRLLRPTATETAGQTRPSAYRCGRTYQGHGFSEPRARRSRLRGTAERLTHPASWLRHVPTIIRLTAVTLGQGSHDLRHLRRISIRRL